MHECAKSRAVIYANLAACHLKLEDNAGAVKACNEALLDDPAYIKALHRRAQANETIGNWSSLSSALDDYKTLSQMHETPASLRATLRTKLQTLPPRIEEVGKKEKEEMMQKLKGVGDSVLGWFGLSTDNFKITQQEGGGSSIQFVPNQGTKK
ncbi:hypothetical protein IE81DRAFT_291043 [Ceraceosorus guamensis]|uniref:TPR-like protein n=1 Tax=Ceraceosorus guamensis TaxID=1522189 RepID=A0A316VWY3_9BASI|nr:hypothetical protein IE81DRAFT_291043 [Ceraceosorus guamensis]PWN41962.1 hypothetical protein IE81DRAFT_291043 [Ceraceosorus guamensis]